MTLLESVEAQLQLAEKLARCARVAALDTEDEPQGFTLAYNLAHLEASCRTLLDDQLRKLVVDPLTPDETLDALHDIAEELRHILYHIKAPAFFAYLDY